MDDRIIIGRHESVRCPHCSQGFELHLGIGAQSIEQHIQAFANESRALREAISVEAGREAERRVSQAYTGQLSALQDQLSLAKRSEREARESIEKARNEARERALADGQQQLKAVQEDLQRQAAELGRLRQTELDLRRERQQLEEKQRNLDLELQRRLDEERSKLSASIQARESERFGAMEAEWRKKMEDAHRANEDLRRKLEQGSQQLQGEVLELAVEESLSTSFFHDLIEEVKKGQRGADVIQTVRTPLGQVAGRIIWEAKRAENWSDKWLVKLKDDQQEAKADLAVLVTTSMPRGVEAPFARLGDVWVVTPQVLLPMAETLRVILLEAHKLKVANTGKAEKIELLYNYLSSPGFGQRMRTVLDCFTAMQSELDAEKRAMTKIWARRQTQIERASLGMGTVVGEIQGIAQDTLPALRELDSIEAIANSSGGLIENQTNHQQED